MLEAGPAIQPPPNSERRRVTRENVYHVVPLPGMVWAAVGRSWGIPGISGRRWRIGWRGGGGGNEGAGADNGLELSCPASSQDYYRAGAKTRLAPSAPASCSAAYGHTDIYVKSVIGWR